MQKFRFAMIVIALAVLGIAAFHAYAQVATRNPNSSMLIGSAIVAILASAGGAVIGLDARREIRDQGKQVIDRIDATSSATLDAIFTDPRFTETVAEKVAEAVSARVLDVDRLAELVADKAVHKSTMFIEQRLELAGWQRPTKFNPKL